MGSVHLVLLSADAYHACLTHALSNEEEEVMGLCIGEMSDTPLGCEIYISTTMSLRRLDKRKDRVEISVEQLSNASTKVEELSQRYGKQMRIVGWYHSHPKITVWPSHVDTSTQAMYQMMDETFVGLIFSCFNEEKSSCAQSVHVTCFQSVAAPEWNPMQQDRVEIPIAIDRSQTMGPECSVALKELPKILMQEEDDMFENAISAGDDFMTRLHNSSVHVQALCKLNSNFLLPMLQVSERRNIITQQRIKEVEEENKSLKERIENLKAELGEH